MPNRAVYSSLPLFLAGAGQLLRAALWSLVAMALSSAGAAPAEDFAPISAAERAFEQVPSQPEAPAVKLFERAVVQLMNYPQEASSSLQVEVRLKILTEEGKRYGEVVIPHSRHYRLKRLAGRTVLPDGTVVPLAEDAVFEERRSKSEKRYVTKLVFPAVEVGAILDYTYTVFWDSLIYIEPWYFHGVLPVVHSEISYIKPDNLGLQPWSVQTTSHPMQTEVNNHPRGKVLRVWVDGLPGLPDEPFSPPFEALSSRVMMIPKSIYLSGEEIPLLESWQDIYELYEGDYKKSRRKSGKAKQQAASLTAAASSLLEKITAIYAFVRDEITTIPIPGVGLEEGETADDVLATRRGSPAGKALLLQAMLASQKIDSGLVWAADRELGIIDLNVANPWWFDTVLARVELDGQALLLDPGDPSSAVGRVAPYYEGTKALLIAKGMPEIIEIPVSAYDRNSSRARVDLRLDADGRIAGGGSLELAGHQAWRVLGIEEALEHWRERLADGFPGYDVEEVTVEEDPAGQRVRVDWTLKQPDREVLGDEATIFPARPIGPMRQLFSLPPQHRKTPVLMPFGLLEEVVTTVQWPEGWEIDNLPQEISYRGKAGGVELRVDVAAQERQLTVERRFERSGYVFDQSEGYGSLRELYGQATEADARPVVLVSD